MKGGNSGWKIIKWMTEKVEQESDLESGEMRYMSEKVEL